MKKLLFPLLIVLSACQSRIVTVTEYIDRPVYCANKVPVKIYDTDHLAQEDPVAEKVRALLIERRQREITEIKLRSELGGCEKPPIGPPAGDTQ